MWPALTGSLRAGKRRTGQYYGPVGIEVDVTPDWKTSLPVVTPRLEAVSYSRLAGIILKGILPSLLMTP
jgi:hypothetical protein